MTIIVKILGGMGNQMFQYAAAKNLALKLGTELLLDIESLKRHGERPFDLGHFSITDKIANPNDFSKLGYSVFSYPLIKIKKHPNYYLEKEFTYNENLKNISLPVYLDGYFQSEKYFKEFETEIRKLLSFKLAANQNELIFTQKMQSSTPVSLHVRRGDYVTNPKATAQMGILDLYYYQNAMEILESKIANITYFIFSDDVEWVKSNLKVSRPVIYVTGNNGENAFRDMRLMSQCHHHIIANSSFSWWGAWLNPNQEKVIVAPRKWFQQAISDQDLVPSHWLRV